MKKILFGTTLVFALVLSSCSTFKKVDIVKRHYKNGYHIAIRDQKTKTEPVAVVKEKQKAETIAAATPAAVTADAPEQPAVQQRSASENAPAVTATNRIASVKQTAAEPAVASVKKERTKPAHSLRTPTLKSKTWSTGRSTSGGDVDLVILVILAILLPPLAVYLAEGITGKFWLTLILCLLGGGLAVGVLGYIGLLWLIAIIIALLTVLK